MVKRALFIVLLLLLPRLVMAQQTTATIGTYSQGDVCNAYPHSSIPLTFAAATSLTQQIALAAGKAIYVCGLTFVTAATSTLQLEYGTGANCATGTNTLSGTYLSSSTVSTSTNATLMVTPISQELCAVTTGATGQANGWLSYVQF